jgi:hypothetical protein
MTRAVTTGSTVGSLLALSVLLRAMFPGVTVPSVPASPAAASPTTAVPASATPGFDDGPWKASQRFFAGGVPECGEKPDAPATRAGRWCIPDDTSVLALIAIAPDPVRTHMALQFDRALEAIELAAGSAGYVISQYWLPWSVESPKPASDTGGKSSQSDPTPQQREERAAQPGLVLLRRDAGPTSTDPKLLYVFVVADTATTGIDGKQFANAVKYLDEVCAPASAAVGCKPADPIRIIGPTFSGSLASLRRLTNVRSPRKFVAYSGSVSSACAMTDQRLETPSGSPCMASAMPSDNLSLRSFVFGTELAIARFVETLQHSHAVADPCGTPQIAVLSEGATTFGQVTTSRQATGCVQNFVFPREISNLRNASRATGTSTTGASSDPSAPRPFLQLDLTDRTNSNDAPPDFSTKQGPLSKEAVLMTMAAELRRARYRYVGIVSTNVLDTLYLAEFLRAASPDARLFMISADQLFEREIDNVPYVGMLAITTYPLFQRNSDWTMAPSEPRFPFADEYEQGGYNATLQAMNELLRPNPERALNQFLPPGVSSASDQSTIESPPLWMTVVGAEGYWPVELLSRRADVTRPSLTGADFSGAWQVLVVLISGLAALHIGVLLTASPFSTRFRDFAPVAAVPRQRLFYIQTASATLVVGLGLLLIPAWRYARTFGWLQALGTLAVVALILAAVLSEALYYLRWKWQAAHDEQKSEPTDPPQTKAAKRALGGQILTFVAVWVATAGLLAFWWYLLGPDLHTDTHDESSYGFFFAYRIVHPVTGISPLPPLIPLLITVYAWACFEIWRLRFNEDMRPRLFFAIQTGASDKRQRPGERTEQRIASAVNQYLLRPGYFVTGTVLFVVWLAFLHPESPFELFEHQAFSVLYTVLFCLVVALMLSSAFRMMQIWVDLRLLLIDLERSPVRTAFSRVKGLSWSFWRQGGEDAEWVYMSRALEKLGQLGSGSGSRASGLPTVSYFTQQIESLRARVQTLTAQFSEPKAIVPDRSGLKALASDVATFRTRLKLGDPNPFLQSAADDLCRALKTCVVLRDTETHESVQSALAAVAGRLEDLAAIVNLMTESTTALSRVGTIIKPWRALQEKPPLFSALDSFREYRDAVRKARTKDDSRIALYADVETAFRRLQEALAKVLGKAWDVLEADWSKDAPQLVDYDSRDPGGRDKAEAAPDPVGRQRQCLEEFIGLRYVAFIRGVLGHLRHVMIFLALSFSLVLVSLNIYSFEPHQSLIWSFTLIFVVAGVMVVGVLMQLHRDPILSRVTGTTGNTLDIHFYLRIVAFGALPLLTLLATHFPSIGHYLLSFLRPSLEALK